MVENIKKLKVTVFIPVYNGEKYLADAIRSILNQSFKDFELLIIDDGSTDESGKIIDSFNDNRIRKITHGTNLGMLESFNEGMKKAQGEYIARMDADDIAYPARLERQVNFFDKHKNCVLLGTGTNVIDSESNPTGVVWKSDLPPEELPIALLFHNRFTHPSVMIRKSALPEPAFQSGLTPAEDYDLWLRLSKKGQLANLPDVLTKYRIHGKNISLEKKTQKDTAVNKIITEQLNVLGINPTREELVIHKTNYGYAGSDVLEFLGKREKWLRFLISQNEDRKIYPQAIFKQVAASQWLTSCDTNSRIGWLAWKIFWSSPLFEQMDKIKNAKTLAKFLVKVVLSKLKWASNQSL